MPRDDKDSPDRLNVPWITEDGYLDPTKLPIGSTLTQAVAHDAGKFRSACRTLTSMALGGRTEAAVFLYGLLAFCGDDRAKKESVVEALRHVRTRQSADLLFGELRNTESSTATRRYINTILKALEGFPLASVADGFEGLLSDSRWSYRMKRKFREALAGIEARSRWSTSWPG